METGLGWFVNFTRESATELDAILLRNHLTERFSNRIQTIKSKAYERGWSDKTKRRPKSGGQSSYIDNLDV